MQRYDPLRMTLLVSGLALSLAGGALADEWPAYGRDPQGTRYSPLTQIAPENVAKLKPAWTFHTGDFSDGKQGAKRSGFETTPLLADGRLFLTTPFNRIIALNAATGQLIWAYDPKIDKKQDYGDGFINRGLAAWRDPAPPRGNCRLRLFETTLDARLLALDAQTGLPCLDFGMKGQVDLYDVPNYQPGRYHMTSPPLVLDGVVVVGSSINDNNKVEMPDGAVRGYDARTGNLLWTWEPLKRPSGVAPEAWRAGAANAWSIFSADPERHLVYVPTGSASPDYYGGLRPGDDKWANSVVALDARTGKLVWGFQLVHHDLWDYDTAATPLRADLMLDGKRHAAVIAGNKTGMLFVLDAATGKPLLPVQERAVPGSDLPGENASPTQPFPITLPPLAPQSLSPDNLWSGLTDADREACRTLIANVSGASLFTPPSVKDTIETPGVLGGINWSGFAWDQLHQRLIVPVSNLPEGVQMIPADKFAAGVRGDFSGDNGMQSGAPFSVTRNFLLSPSHRPCNPPPWGELVTLDLVSGKIAWHQPVGDMRDVFPGAAGDEPGSLMLGGPIVTASGLIFIGGTMDRRFHALSADTGKELWSADLPASAHAQPITYKIDGKQFVVIAAGGAAKIDEERQSDAVVAFALP